MYIQYYDVFSIAFIFHFQNTRLKFAVLSLVYFVWHNPRPFSLTWTKLS